MSPYEMDSIKLKYKKNEVTKNSYSHALINGDRKNIFSNLRRGNVIIGYI